MALLRTLKFIANHPLNRGHRRKALLRFVKWQVGSRLLPGQVVYPWIGGAKIVVRPGETGLTGNIYCGLHEFEEMAFLLHAIGPGDLFVDVGANVGSYTILACAVRGARGCAFEPVPKTHARLMDNLRINGLVGQVHAYNIGLAAEDGDLVFSGDEDTANHAIAPGEARTETVRVPVRTLDGVLEGHSPVVIKIDVEGFETAVLAGARTTLQRESLHAVIMELNGSGARYGFDENAILASMAEHGFSAFRYEPFSRDLVPLRGKNTVSGNTIFVRNQALVQRRIRESAPVPVGDVLL